MIKSTRLLLALAGLAALPQLALAHEDHGAAATAETTASLVVVRDAETGLLRAATAEEQSKLQIKAARSPQGLRSMAAQPETNLQKTHISGARGARMTDEFISMSVVHRKADGTLVQNCYGSKEEAEAALKAATAAAVGANRKTAQLDTE